MQRMFILLCLVFLYSGNIFGQKKDTTPPYATESNYQDLIKNKTAAFIQFGFAGIDGQNFQKKYGISVRNMGCLVSPDMSKKAQENNTVLIKYLNKKYGNTWEKDLGFKPYGTKP
ncbi:hypothetical protein M2T87_01315 [Elizabethkingia ursingii]|jgi:hypothetical protein|nr:hypothetical protein [Elizabethkingia ursingii]